MFDKRLGKFDKFIYDVHFIGKTNSKRNAEFAKNCPRKMDARKGAKND